MAYGRILISQSGDTLVASLIPENGYTLEPIVWNWYSADGVSQTGHVDHGSFTSSFTPSAPGTYYAQCQFNWTSTTGTPIYYYSAAWDTSKPHTQSYYTTSNYILYTDFDLDTSTGKVSVKDAYKQTGKFRDLMDMGAIYFQNGNMITGYDDSTYEWLSFSAEKNIVGTDYETGTTHVASDKIYYDPVVNPWTNWASWDTGTELSNLSAYTWNAFTAWVNRVRSRAGLGAYNFTSVSSGDLIAATTVNQARSAIAAISGHGTLPDAVSKGDPIRGAWFRQLAEAANAVL